MRTLSLLNRQAVLAAPVPHIRAGTVRLLAVTDPRRNRQFPQAPTLEEHYREFADAIRREIERWRAAVQESGAQVS
ncbi:MAG: hypothetical protein ACYC0T_04435 [Ramlibacter sp.]